MEDLLEMSCKVGKQINFVKDIDLFKIIMEYHGNDSGEGAWLTTSRIKEAVSYSLK